MGGLDLPETPFSKVVDGALSAIGRAASWLWVALLGVIVINVALRYLFGEGRVELEELQWHINSVAFMLAVAYAYRVDAHIRIDLVSSKLRPRTQAWVELYGTVLLLLPFVILVVVFSLPFVAHSWSVSEVSQSPGGLPFRWLLKGFLPALRSCCCLQCFPGSADCGRTWGIRRHERLGTAMSGSEQP